MLEEKPAVVSAQVMLCLDPPSQQAGVTQAAAASSQSNKDLFCLYFYCSWGKADVTSRRDAINAVASYTTVCLGFSFSHSETQRNYLENANILCHRV